MQAIEDRKYARKWRRTTEQIIAASQLAIALLVAALYFNASKPTDATGEHFTVFALSTYPLICAARLALARWAAPGQIFGWVSTAFDIVILTVIICRFSSEYGNWAASLKAPTFGFYFIIIALHALRFRPALTFGAGVMAAACWTILVFGAYHAGAPVTHSYLEYVNGANLLIGAEIEKIFGLLTFSGVLAIATQRGSALLAKAQQAAVAKSMFLATMSHEIRTPMNGFLGMIDVLGATELDEKQREYLRVIRSSGNALLSVINDVLDFSKIESNHMQFRTDPFNIKTLTEEVLHCHRACAEDKGLDLVFSAEPCADSTIIGDEGRMRQVLNNLINNAIKFTDAGSVHVALAITSAGPHRDVEITVSDTGIGIAESDIERIFAMFEQADNSTTRSRQGTGLGLAITRQLVEGMGGTISVESAPGKGSAFTVRFVLEVNDSVEKNSAVESGRPAPSTKHIPAPAAEQKTGKLRVLLAEDNEVNRMVIQHLLNDMPCEFSIAENGLVAVEQFRTAGADVVLMDFSMPEMDGLAATREIRRIEEKRFGKRTPIIGVTAHTGEIDRDSAIEAGMDDVVTKPVNAEILKQTIGCLAAPKNIEMAAAV